MATKDFEQTIRFYSAQTPTGETFSLPLINVYLVQPNGNRMSLSLLFDTGASVTSLRKDLYHLLGVPSWDSGIRVQSNTGGSEVPVDHYRYEGIILEVFGKAISCPINLIEMPPHPLFVGLLGREVIFSQFGFGFWEKTGELFTTSNP